MPISALAPVSNSNSWGNVTQSEGAFTPKQEEIVQKIAEQYHADPAKLRTGVEHLREAIKVPDPTQIENAVNEINNVLHANDAPAPATQQLNSNNGQSQQPQ